MTGMRLLRRLRFSLRALMVAVLVIGLGLGALVRKMNHVKAQRRAVATIESLGGFVAYDYQFVNGDPTRAPYVQTRPRGPEWLLRLTGDDFFQHVVVAFVPSPVSREAELAVLEDLPHLQEVTLPGTKSMTRGALVHLRGCRALKSLSLANDAGTRDADLALLSDHTDLEFLNLSGSSITDDGMDHLVGLKRLESLGVDQTSVTVAGIAKLKELPRLKWVSLPDSRVNREGLEELQRLLPNVTIFVWGKGLSPNG